MIAITGASGQLGRLVIDRLLDSLPATEIVAAVRRPDKAADLAARGVVVRHADYDVPDTLVPAFDGVDKLLMISGSEVGKRAPQHRALIEAAVAAGVKFVAYTSLLHADDSPLVLAGEHRQTEAMLRDSGLEHALLRNGWYVENHLAGIGPALEHGALLGSARDGRISAAPRADYADAAVAVLRRDDQAGSIHELAGDASFTLTELAAEIARQSGKPVLYRDLPPAEYRAVLEQAGLPPPVATLYAELDDGAASGTLRDDGRQLSALIGRPTSTMSSAVATALAS